MLHHAMRAAAALLLCATTAMASAAGPRQPADPTAPPRLASAAALVQAVNGGRTALARGVGETRSIASITKLMTAIVVLDEGLPLSDILDVGEDDADTVKGTRSRLKRARLLTREELLTAALLSSDNMAALALSRHSAGGREAFVRRMNLKARRLGLLDTAFVDPAGLSPENRATAEDVARLLAVANGYPFIRAVTTRRDALIHGVAYRNTNPWAAEPEWGIQLSKTGFTNEAGRCIAVIMEVAGAQYSVVLLGAKSLRARARDLAQIRQWLHHRHAASAALPAALQAPRWEVDEEGRGVGKGPAGVGTLIETVEGER